MYEFIGLLKNNDIPIESFCEREESEKLLENSYCFFSQESFYIEWDSMTPSEILGFSEIEEKKVRIFCNTLIQEAGIVLKLPQKTVLTSMNIFNRFFYRKNFIKFEPFLSVCATIFISTKEEESLRRLRDVISSCYFILKTKENKKNKEKCECILDINSDLYGFIRQSVITYEIHILKELGFCLYELSEHAHKYLPYFIKQLKATQNLLQKSWNYLNDCYRTTLPVNYPPHVLACSSIFLAARIYFYPLPVEVNWWELFETSIYEIQEVCSEILSLYEIGQIDIKEVKIILRKFSSHKEEAEKQEQIILEEIKNRNKKFNKNHRSRSRSRSRGRKRSRSRSRSRSRGYKNRHKKYSNKHKKHKKRKYSRSSKSSSHSSSYRSKS